MTHVGGGLSTVWSDEYADAFGFDRERVNARRLDLSFMTTDYLERLAKWGVTWVVVDDTDPFLAEQAEDAARAGKSDLVRSFGDIRVYVLRRAPPLSAHQTSQRSLRTIFASGLHENACANSGRFESGPLTRKLRRRVRVRRDQVPRAPRRGSLPHQACAKPRKNCCSGVNSPFAAGARPRGLAPSSRAYASFTPPRSAMFSPSVSLPLTCTSPRTT